MKKSFSLSLLIAALFTISLSSCKSGNEVIAVADVAVNPTTLSIKAGDGSQLTAIITPNNATNKRVKWASSNIFVAKVDSAGYVMAIAAGSATITATTEDGNKIATCKVNVTGEGGVDDSYYSREPQTPATFTASFTTSEIIDCGDYFKTGAKNVSFSALQRRKTIYAEFFIDLKSNEFTPGVYNINKSGTPQTMLASNGYEEGTLIWKAASYCGDTDEQDKFTSIYFMVSGTATVTSDKIEISARSYFGSTISITYQGDMTLVKMS